MRTLYAYEAQRPEDLGFGEDELIKAHPSKSGGDWWHGTLESSGQSGAFPMMYVEEVKREFDSSGYPRRKLRPFAAIPAKALYDYTAGSPGELSLTEGASLTIVDNSNSDWFKAIDNGRIGLVPAAYVEIGG